MEEKDSVLESRTMSKYTHDLIECLYLAKRLENAMYCAIMEHYGRTESEAAEKNAQEVWEQIKENVIGDAASQISYMIGESISEHLDDLSGTEY